MVSPIDVKRKGSVSVGCWVQYVTLTFDLTHDLDLGCFKVKFQNSSISGIVGLIDVKWKWNGLIWYWADCMTLPFDHTHDLDPGVEISRLVWGDFRRRRAVDILVKYVHIYPIIDFRIMVIPEASFQAGAIEFGSVRGLDTLINRSSGFYDHQKNAILAEYSMHFLAMLRQSHFIKRTVNLFDVMIWRNHCDVTLTEWGPPFTCVLWCHLRLPLISVLADYHLGVAFYWYEWMI